MADSSPFEFPDVSRLLPHQPPMRLLDRVVSRHGAAVEAEVDVVPAAGFFEPGRGIPAWIGVEYLGQTAAAWVAVAVRAEAAGADAPPPPGMLVASRRYSCASSYFPEGATLTARVWPVTPQDAALVRFAGEIRIGGEQVAEGEVSVYLSRET